MLESTSLCEVVTACYVQTAEVPQAYRHMYICVICMQATFISCTLLPISMSRAPAHEQHRLPLQSVSVPAIMQQPSLMLIVRALLQKA